MTYLKILIIILIAIFGVADSKAQVSNRNGTFIAAKEFSKEISLFQAKSFVVQNVLGKSSKVEKFTIDALAAASSGDLTSLVYECDDRNMQGLILAFYGNYWNPAGVLYQGYDFKALGKKEGLELISMIESVLDKNSKFLGTNYDNNTLHFTSGDLTVMISAGAAPKIRLFWQGFDAVWDITAFKRTKRRLERRLGDD